MTLAAWDPSSSALQRVNQDLPLFWSVCLQDPEQTFARCELEGRRIMRDEGRNGAWGALYLALCIVRIEALCGREISQ